MAYINYNLPDQIKGDTWTFEFTIQNSQGEPIDITSNEYWLTLKSSPDLADEFATIQVGPIVAASVEGIVTITVPETDTINVEAASYYYDLQEVTPQNNINTLLLGKIKVLKGVTRVADYDGTGSPIAPITTTSGTALYFGTTTSPSSVEIYLKDTAAGRVGISENSSIAFNAFITGKDKVTKESCSFQFNGAAERDITSQFIGAPGKFILGRENSAFNAEITVDAALNSLLLIVTPVSANETVWAGRIDYTEVFY